MEKTSPLAHGPSVPPASKSEPAPPGWSSECKASKGWKQNRRFLTG